MVRTYKENKNYVKRLLLKFSKEGAFLGSALSVIDIIGTLYDRYSFNKNLDNADHLFLSKGHAVIALYAVLINKEILPLEVINEYNKNDSLYYYHPNPAIKQIETFSGSLGHLLSVAIGSALINKKREQSVKTFVILGDGELDEGSNWESLIVANKCHLDNLFVIIDRNKIQANYYTEELSPLEPLYDKFTAFGAEVFVLESGNDCSEINSMLQEIDSIPPNGKMKVIIANTVRGYGITSHENSIEKWFVEIDEAEEKKLEKGFD